MGGLAGVIAWVVCAALSLCATERQKVARRRMGEGAECSALRETQEPKAWRRHCETFVPTTLSQPDPPTWDYVLLENHPTIMQRLAMVAAWRKRYATSTAQLP